jgi:hypothetical protein
VSFQNGFEVYYLSYGYEGFKYRLKIALKDDEGDLIGLTLL